MGSSQCELRPNGYPMASWDKVEQHSSSSRIGGHLRKLEATPRFGARRLPSGHHAIQPTRASALCRNLKWLPLAPHNG